MTHVRIAPKGGANAAAKTAGSAASSAGSAGPVIDFPLSVPRVDTTVKPERKRRPRGAAKRALRQSSGTDRRCQRCR